MLYWVLGKEERKVSSQCPKRPSVGGCRAGVGHTFSLEPCHKEPCLGAGLSGAALQQATLDRARMAVLRHSHKTRQPPFIMSSHL